MVKALCVTFVILFLVPTARGAPICAKNLAIENQAGSLWRISQTSSEQPLLNYEECLKALGTETDSLVNPSSGRAIFLTRTPDGFYVIGPSQGYFTSLPDPSPRSDSEILRFELYVRDLNGGVTDIDVLRQGNIDQVMMSGGFAIISGHISGQWTKMPGWDRPTSPTSKQVASSDDAISLNDAKLAAMNEALILLSRSSVEYNRSALCTCARTGEPKIIAKVREIAESKKITDIESCLNDLVSKL